VVEQLVKRTCKCHGVSGSCSIKTCWNQLAAFSETAAVIKNKYDNAVQVNVEIRENASHLRTVSSSSKNQESNRILPQSRAKKATDQLDDATVAALARNTGSNSGGSSVVNAGDRVDRKELIYQQRSPDFCVASPLGPGTTDRQCLRGENCEILCCGRGYNVHRLTVSTPCKCKLILCCQVECQNCLVEKTIHTCKWKGKKIIRKTAKKQSNIFKWMGGHQNNIRKYSNLLSIILFIGVGWYNSVHDGYTVLIQILVFFFFFIIY